MRYYELQWCTGGRWVGIACAKEEAALFPLLGLPFLGGELRQIVAKTVEPPPMLDLYTITYHLMGALVETGVTVKDGIIVAAGLTLWDLRGRPLSAAQAWADRKGALMRLTLSLPDPGNIPWPAPVEPPLTT